MSCGNDIFRFMMDEKGWSGGYFCNIGIGKENMIEVLYILKVFFGCINIGNDIGNMF